MSQAIHLGIDVGGTASRWVACSDTGDIVTRGTTTGATGHLFNPAEKQRLDQALTSIATELTRHDLAASFVTIGMTGYGAAVFQQMLDLLAQTFGVAAANTIIVDDMTLAYAAIFQPGEGHLISAGTGSIGLHITAGGQSVRVGGRGILIDDAGSGSWIALRALDRIYRCLDHTGSFDAVSGLATALFTAIGGDDWHAVRQYVYGGDRGIIGALAIAVAKAADQGDQTARIILTEAAGELADLALALTQRTEPHAIGYIGGVLTLHSTITEEIRRRLPSHDVRFVQSDAALAAARLHLPVNASWKNLLSQPAA